MHRPGAIVAVHHSFDPTSLVSILVASLRWEAAVAVMRQLLPTRCGLPDLPRAQKSSASSRPQARLSRSAGAAERGDGIADGKSTGMRARVKTRTSGPRAGNRTQRPIGSLISWAYPGWGDAQIPQSQCRRALATWPDLAGVAASGDRRRTSLAHRRSRRPRARMARSQGVDVARAPIITHCERSAARVPIRHLPATGTSSFGTMLWASASGPAPPPRRAQGEHACERS
jgi:hypothetical protein